MAILSLSVSNISGKQRRQVIDDRRRKYNAVKPVKDSSVARDQLAIIFNVVVALTWDIMPPAAQMIA